MPALSVFDYFSDLAGKLRRNTRLTEVAVPPSRKAISHGLFDALSQLKIASSITLAAEIDEARGRRVLPRHDVPLPMT